MKGKNLLLGGFLLLFCLFLVSSQGGEVLEISPDHLYVTKLSNELMEETLEVKNKGDSVVFLRVSGISGKVSEAIPSVDKIWIRINPGERGSIHIRGYVADVSPGTYHGKIFLESEEKRYEVPITLQVGKESPEISLSLTIEPLKREIPPGSSLEVKSTLKNLGREEIKVELELSLLNKENGQEIVKKTTNLSLVSFLEKIVEIRIPEDAKETTYQLKGRALVREAGIKKEKASDIREVVVKKPLGEFFSPFFRIFNLSNLVFMFFVIILIVLAYVSYHYYMEEKWGKKRYLASVVRSIDFQSLPKYGKRTAFLGKVAGTNYKAFFEIDELKNHVLIAGATGTGKTVAAQLIAEEVLDKDVAVIVFDPTAQWTGFLRENTEERIFKLYPHFGMRREEAKRFEGTIQVITDPEEFDFKVDKYLKPGEITIFCLNKLDTPQIEPFIAESIRKIYQRNLEESPELRLLLVYEEIHRILPKFGGVGRGLNWLERGAREFRKWGVGLVLISQVLSDFKGEIKANIGTEIQLMSKYEGDLERIKLKYGQDVHRCVVKAAIGEGMIQNAEYNRGKPYILRFRPPLHSLRRLKDAELDKYYQYSQKIDNLKEKVAKLKNMEVDVFDLEIELNLADDNLKKGSFGVVDLYLDSLKPRIIKLYEKYKKV